MCVSWMPFLILSIAWYKKNSDMWYIYFFPESSELVQRNCSFFLESEVETLGPVGGCCYWFRFEGSVLLVMCLWLSSITLWLLMTSGLSNCTWFYGHFINVRTSFFCQWCLSMLFIKLAPWHSIEGEAIAVKW